MRTLRALWVPRARQRAAQRPSRWLTGNPGASAPPGQGQKPGLQKHKAWSQEHANTGKEPAVGRGSRSWRETHHPASCQGGRVLSTKFTETRKDVPSAHLSQSPHPIVQRALRGWASHHVGLRSGHISGGRGVPGQCEGPGQGIPATFLPLSVLTTGFPGLERVMTHQGKKGRVLGLPVPPGKMLTVL